MSKRFVILAHTRLDRFTDNVSIGDADGVEFDASPWEAENATITSAVWTVESGSAAVSGTSLTSGVASGLITYSQAGKVLISVLFSTGTKKKKVWLEVLVKDLRCADDYGFSA